MCEPIHVTGLNHFVDSLYKHKDKLLVIMFTADWCGPCKRIKKMIFDPDNKNRKQNLCFVNDQAVFLYIDTSLDEMQLLISDEHVKSLPTFLFARIRDNARTILQRFEGADQAKLIQALKTL